MECSLGVFIVWKRSLVFPILLVSSISLHWSLRKAFLSLLAILWNSAFKWEYLSFPFRLCLLLLFFSQLFVNPPQTTICLFAFVFLGMVLITPSCTISQTSIHSSSGTLSDLIPWIYFSFPLYNHKGFDLGHTWMSSGFPYFLQFQSEFSNKEFIIWATVHSQSCFCWLYRASRFFYCKEHNQSGFSIDHLLMSMCRVFSCVIGRVCSLWSGHSLGKTLLAFDLLHFILQGQICDIIYMWN